jgi:hypothetical protein
MLRIYFTSILIVPVVNVELIIVIGHESKGTIIDVILSDTKTLDDGTGALYALKWSIPRPTKLFPIINLFTY